MIDLTAQTTFRLPFQAATVIELASLETAATQLQGIDAPALVLAGGSNWIQLDPTFLGTVIRPRLMHCHAETVQDEVRLRVGAGVLWHQLVMDTLASGWYGLENLALIPGWVGAAPIQNIGAYGVELSSVCTAVLAWDFVRQQQVMLTNDDCAFAYRDSLFKRDPTRYCILEVHLTLHRRARTSVDYGAIRDAVSAAGGDLQNPLDIAHAVIAIRQSKLPDPQVIPNVGSFFKNPVVSVAQRDALLKRHPDLPHFPDQDGVKIAAGFLIDQAGWRGRWIGSVGVHADQALVLVNNGEPVLADLRTLVKQVRSEIKARYHIHLDVEPTQVGRSLI